MDRATASRGDAVIAPEDVEVLGEAELGTSAVVPDDWPKASAAAVNVKVRAAADSRKRVLRDLLILFLFLRMIERWIVIASLCLAGGRPISLRLKSVAYRSASVDEVRFSAASCVGRDSRRMFVPIPNVSD
jgi:hypothetical protein